MNKSNGFTLLEVIIAITILGILGTLAGRSIQQALNNKKKIQETVDDTSKIRDALRLMEKDLNLAYHHRDWEKEVQDLVRKGMQPQTGQNAAQQGIPGQTSTTQQPGTPANTANRAGAPPYDPYNPTGAVQDSPRKDPATNFMGSESELHFVTMNTGRLLKNIQQADFIEVGYFLKNCRTADGKSSSNCLWRRSSPWVDKDVTKGGQELVLLENVTEFGLRYLGRGKQDWVKDWKTDVTGDGATRNNFPWAVEISLTMQRNLEGKSEKGKKYSMQIVAPIHFPNNDDGATGNAAPGAINPLTGLPTAPGM